MNNIYANHQQNYFDYKDGWVDAGRLGFYGILSMQIVAKLKFISKTNV